VRFYGELFGWQLSTTDSGTTIDTPGINGHIGASPTGEAWAAICVETDDPQATLDRANALGATTMLPVTSGGAGPAAMFRDPDGLPVGLVRAESPADGTAVAAEAVDWFEILGSDATRTQQFYADLFGWKVDASGFPDYTVVDPGGRGIWGGIGGGQPSRWATVYAAVADVDETLRRAEELGGSRVDAPEVVALKTAARAALYGSAGDMKTGMFRDPAGNVFGVYAKH
jgi:predicted enzyme related to lactoylglutathione lyase